VLPTLEERVTRLEVRVDEQERLRASQDRDLADISEKLRVQGDLMQALAATQSEHTATLNQHTATLNQHTATLDRHTAMHKEHSGNLARLTLDVHGLKDGMQQIIGMLDTLIERENGR
jgi:chromosome segregation ATPase